jgi:DGQHR domain-containing protein
MNKNVNSTLRLPALEIRQGPRRTLYTFAVDGKELANFATISRIGRTEEHAIKGYQRPEVLSHIADIQQYLESANPMIPNAIVVAFNRTVRFEPSPKNGNRISYSRPGELVIPFCAGEPDENRPAWIVDGQQRMAAISSAKIKSFPICVVGFIAGDDAEQREQFILVNSTKPLPKGLI